MRTDTPSALRPAVFGAATRSAGEAIATTPASVDPYPFTNIGPKAASTPETVAGDIGAAPVTIIRNGSPWAFCLPISGSAVNSLCSMTGTANSTVTC
ncbi:Uncharacterised protein [Mycobacteroides abscessus subsp. massiliense]|nr:Uncharacterised protein [Mycobacteroides abscessus subsp. massiliense]